MAEGLPELDQRLSDELDKVNAAATEGVAPSRELTVQILERLGTKVEKLEKNVVRVETPGDATGKASVRRRRSVASVEMTVTVWSWASRCMKRYCRPVAGQSGVW